MKQVIIYSSSNCSFCIMAKELMESKGIAYKEFLVERNPELVLEVVKKSGGLRTVPQIFIDDYHVGGYDDLAALDNNGELERLLDL